MLAGIAFLCWEPDLITEALTVMPRLQHVCLYVHLTVEQNDYSPDFKRGFVQLCALASRLRSALELPHLTIHLGVRSDDNDEELIELNEDAVRESTNRLLTDARGPSGLLTCPAGSRNVSVSCNLECCSLM